MIYVGKIHPKNHRSHVFKLFINTDGDREDARIEIVKYVKAKRAAVNRGTEDLVIRVTTLDKLIAQSKKPEPPYMDKFRAFMESEWPFNTVYRTLDDPRIASREWRNLWHK